MRHEAGAGVREVETRLRTGSTAVYPVARRVDRPPGTFVPALAETVSAATAARPANNPLTAMSDPRAIGFSSRGDGPTDEPAVRLFVPTRRRSAEVPLLGRLRNASRY